MEQKLKRITSKQDMDCRTVLAKTRIFVSARPQAAAVHDLLDRRASLAKTK
jgi:hypothetical protein